MGIEFLTFDHIRNGHGKCFNSGSTERMSRVHNFIKERENMTPMNLQIQIQAMAIMVRIEGMKAENQQSIQNQTGVQYSEDSFEIKACELDSLWQEVTVVEILEVSSSDLCSKHQQDCDCYNK